MNQMVRINHIETSSLVDGPGERVVVFFQGCALACPGCQSRHTWPTEAGQAIDVEDLGETLVMLSQRHKNVTISGGEATLQIEALAQLITILKSQGRHIVLYTGFTWEELMDTSHPANPYLKYFLPFVDVLVDGRFVKELDDPFISFRGSRNQRAIDVPATLDEGRVVTLDWDGDVQLDEGGALVLPAGYAGMFSEIGDVRNSRMCGQVKPVL